MERSRIKLIVAMIWIVSILVLIAAITALAKTVSASPAQAIQQRGGELAATRAQIKKEPKVEAKVDLSQMKEKLSDEQFNVCFNAATEAPFTGKYWDHHEPGVYHCVACDTPLFSSSAKFDSGTGWPSYYEAVEEGVIEIKEDRSHGMVRTEVNCANCGAHLGHIFDDGPQPTGKRYCINSAALEFRAE